MASPTVNAVMDALAAAGFDRAVSNPASEARPGFAVIANRPGDGIVLVNWHSGAGEPDAAMHGFMLGSYHGILMRDYDVVPAGQSADGPGWLVVSARSTPAPAAGPVGPFETRREASDHPAVRSVYDAMHKAPRRGVGAELCHRILDGACTAAGVEVGAYDHEMIGWLAQWEPETCMVVAGLIARAAAGRGDGGGR
jgi:hypothetical protein